MNVDCKCTEQCKAVVGKGRGSYRVTVRVSCKKPEVLICLCKVIFRSYLEYGKKV